MAEISAYLKKGTTREKPEKWRRKKNTVAPGREQDKDTAAALSYYTFDGFIVLSSCFCAFFLAHSNSNFFYIPWNESNLYGRILIAFDFHFVLIIKAIQHVSFLKEIMNSLHFTPYIKVYTSTKIL